MNIWKTIRQWSRLFWFLGFLVMVGVMTSAMRSKRLAPVSEWHIAIEPTSDGGTFLKESEVIALLGGPFEEDGAKGMDDWPVAEMEARLRSHPQIERVDVFVDARQRVTVRIEQPEVLLRVIDRNGANYYLSTEGRKVPLSRHYTPRVPVVTGDIPLFQDSLVHVEGHVLQQLHELGVTISQDPFSLALAEQIHFSGGEFTLVPKMGRFRILLGDTRGLEEKLGFIRTFYQDILPASGWDTYRLVDLRFKGQIVCRKA